MCVVFFCDLRLFIKLISACFVHIVNALNKINGHGWNRFSEKKTSVVWDRTEEEDQHQLTFFSSSFSIDRTVSLNTFCFWGQRCEISSCRLQCQFEINAFYQWDSETFGSLFPAIAPLYRCRCVKNKKLLRMYRSTIIFIRQTHRHTHKYIYSMIIISYW